MMGASVVGCRKMIITGGTVQFDSETQSTYSSQVISGFFVSPQTWKWTILTTEGFEARSGHASINPGQDDAYCLQPRLASESSSEIYVLFGQTTGDVFIIDSIIQQISLGCNAGSSAASFVDQCLYCPVGTYKEVPGQSRCLPCLEGTTTPTKGSRFQLSCNQCESGFCHQGGVCNVEYDDNNEPKPACRCTIWFTSENCERYSNLFAFVVSAVAVVVFLVPIS